MPLQSPLFNNFDDDDDIINIIEPNYTSKITLQTLYSESEYFISNNSFSSFFFKLKSFYIH